MEKEEEEEEKMLESEVIEFEIKAQIQLMSRCQRMQRMIQVQLNENKGVFCQCCADLSESPEMLHGLF